MNIFGMVQTPYELNTVVKLISTKNGNELAFFLSCDTRSNSVLTKPELEYFEEFHDVCSWETEPIQYGGPVDVEECKEKYDDIRIRSASVNWTAIEDSDLVYLGHDDHFDPVCDVCEERISSQVCEIEPTVGDNFMYTSSVLSSTPINMYTHKNCLSYFLASTLEGIERYGQSEEFLAGVI